MNVTSAIFILWRNKFDAFIPSRYQSYVQSKSIVDSSDGFVPHGANPSIDNIALQAVCSLQKQPRRLALHPQTDQLEIQKSFTKLMPLK